MDQKTRNRRSGVSGKSGEEDYSDEEREWLVAMDRLKRRLGRHPTCPEVLAEAVRIGYRKVEPAKT